MIFTVLAIVCIVYCIGAVITFVSYGILAGAFKDGFFGIVFAAGFAFLWVYLIPAICYEEYERERKKKHARKRNRRN